MFTAGVKLPPLGSPQDCILRDFQIQESRKELAKAKFTAQLALWTAPAGDKNAENKIKAIWSEYVSLVFGMEGYGKDQELELRAEYEKIRKLRPKIKKTKKGSLEVTGING